MPTHPPDNAAQAHTLILREARAYLERLAPDIATYRAVEQLLASAHLGAVTDLPMAEQHQLHLAWDLLPRTQMDARTLIGMLCLVQRPARASQARNTPRARHRRPKCC